MTGKSLNCVSIDLKFSSLTDYWSWRGQLGANIFSMSTEERNVVMQVTNLGGQHQSSPQYTREHQREKKKKKIDSVLYHSLIIDITSSYTDVNCVDKHPQTFNARHGTNSGHDVSCYGRIETLQYQCIEHWVVKKADLDV